MFTCKPVENRSDLSSYEILRINNIIRNNTKLRELGLISESEEKKSNLAAQGISDVDDNKESVNSLDKSKRKQTKRKRQTIKQGSRKSPRLQNLQAAEAKSIDHEKESSSSEDIEKERIVRVEECRQVRLRAAKAIAEAGAEKASKENPTASYEHCLMRVKTMTPKKLENRVSKLRSIYYIDLFIAFLPLL